MSAGLNCHQFILMAISSAG